MGGVFKCESRGPHSTEQMEEHGTGQESLSLGGPASHPEASHPEASHPEASHTPPASDTCPLPKMWEEKWDAEKSVSTETPPEGTF